MKSIYNDDSRVKVFGSFIKRGKHIFRHSTYLQFGENEDVIGSCVLNNPGTSILKDKKDLENLTDGKEVKGQVTIDPTMNQLINIIEKTHGEGIKGKFYIYNLFTLRNSGINEATNYYKKLIKDSEYNYLLNKDFFDFKENVSKLPWVLLGWGCSGAKILTEKKAEWNEYIEKKEIVSLGVGSIQNPVFYKQLCPTGYNQKLEIEEKIVKQINNILNK